MCVCVCRLGIVMRFGASQCILCCIVNDIFICRFNAIILAVKSVIYVRSFTYLCNRWHNTKQWTAQLNSTSRWIQCTRAQSHKKCIHFLLDLQMHRLLNGSPCLSFIKWLKANHYHFTASLNLSIHQPFSWEERWRTRDERSDADRNIFSAVYFCSTVEFRVCGFDVSINAPNTEREREREWNFTVHELWHDYPQNVIVRLI